MQQKIHEHKYNLINYLQYKIRNLIITIELYKIDEIRKSCPAAVYHYYCIYADCITSVYNNYSYRFALKLLFCITVTVLHYYFC